MSIREHPFRLAAAAGASIVGLLLGAAPSAAANLLPVVDRPHRAALAGALALSAVLILLGVRSAARDRSRRSRAERFRRG